MNSIKLSNAGMMNNSNKYLPVGQIIPIAPQTPEELTNAYPVARPTPLGFAALSKSALLSHSALHTVR